MFHFSQCNMLKEFNCLLVFVAIMIIKISCLLCWFPYILLKTMYLFDSILNNENIFSTERYPFATLICVFEPVNNISIYICYERRLLYQTLLHVYLLCTTYLFLSCLNQNSHLQNVRCVNQLYFNFRLMSLSRGFFLR